MKTAGKSDIGKIRKNNEDSFIVDDRLKLFILADGMGGHQAGEVASALAVAEAYECLKKIYSGQPHPMEVRTYLKNAVIAANRAVMERSRSDASLMGMGTTLVIVKILGMMAHVCHVGDSRAYLVRKGIHQITRDHTVSDHLLRTMKMNPERISPESRHILTQAVGIDSSIIPDYNNTSFRPGDMLLLCSDGLTDMLSDIEISGIIERGNMELPETAAALIAEANNRGGRDNITVILIRA